MKYQINSFKALATFWKKFEFPLVRPAVLGPFKEFQCLISTDVPEVKEDVMKTMISRAVTAPFLATVTPTYTVPPLYQEYGTVGTSSAKKSRCALLIAALLGVLSIVCTTDTSYAKELGNVDPRDAGVYQEVPPVLANRCPQGQVKFDGRCRSTAFFNRVLTAGASLIGVSGPPASDSSDTGVIVLEALSENAYNLLYLLPNKAVPGGPRFTTYQYRADYPMVFQQLVTTWQDDQGFLHVFSEDRGPAAGGSTGMTFGMREWTHYVKTAAGNEIHNSDGIVSSSIANGGSGTYCELAAAGAGWIATSASIGGAMYVGALSGAALAIQAGASVIVLGPALFGVGGPEAFLGGVSAAVAIGPTWFGVVTAGGIVVGGLFGELVKEGVETFVCSDEFPDAGGDLEFLPVIPSVPVYPAPTTNMCPGGMALYTGEAMQCTTSSVTTSTNPDATDDDIESGDTLCIENYVYQQCVYI